MLRGVQGAGGSYHEGLELNKDEAADDDDRLVWLKLFPGTTVRARNSGTPADCRSVDHCCHRHYYNYQLIITIADILVNIVFFIVITVESNWQDDWIVPCWHTSHCMHMARSTTVCGSYICKTIAITIQLAFWMEAMNGKTPTMLQNLKQNNSNNQTTRMPYSSSVCPPLSQKSGSLFLLYFSNNVKWICPKVLTVFLTTWLPYFLKIVRFPDF